MTTATETSSTPMRSHVAQSNYRSLRICCWAVAIVLGAAQAWATRFSMNPDGVSYLDIGDAYWRGDWHNAINAYWSPLYSWILGFFLKVARPSAYWEYPLVHLVNFMIYLAVLGCFEFFLATFIANRKRRNNRLAEQGLMGIPEAAWWLLGYSLFVSCSLLLIGLALVTPDMCVAGFAFLASALLIRIHHDRAAHSNYIALGVVLGFGYLSKAVMLPLGFLFLIISFGLSGLSRISIRRNALALLSFSLISGLYIVLLSNAKGRVTFSDVGPIAYEVYVDHVDQFVPTAPTLEHPVRKILLMPATFEFTSPISGTYPLWYDSAFWHMGIRPHFSLQGQKQVLYYGLLVYYAILTWAHLPLAVSFFALLCICAAPRQFFRCVADIYYLLIVPIAALLLYWIVYTEPRYVAPFVLIGWLVVFSGLQYRSSLGSRRLLMTFAIAIAVTTAIFQGVPVFLNARQQAPSYWRVAQMLSDAGLKPGDNLAVIGADAFGEGGAFAARLARMRIVAQTSASDTSWTNNPKMFSEFIEAMRQSHVRAVLWHTQSQPASAAQWTAIASTDLYIHLIDQAPKYRSALFGTDQAKGFKLTSRLFKPNSNF